jgi:two-component system chemotaxis response regulator CheY
MATGSLVPRTSARSAHCSVTCSVELDQSEASVSPTVMIVEDDPSTRRLYRFLLANSGYTVVEAEDGIAALEHLQKTAVDVIITDMNMPRMGGMELVRTLRQNYSDVHVIMVTAFGTPDTEKNAYRAGVNEYLTKPFEFEELERRVKEFFARRKV